MHNSLDTRKTDDYLWGAGRYSRRLVVLLAGGFLGSSESGPRSIRPKGLWVSKSRGFPPFPRLLRFPGPVHILADMETAALFDMTDLTRPREPTPWEKLMGGLRELGYDMCRTTGSVASALHKYGGYSFDEILHMAHGQVLLAQTGKWDMTRPWPLLPLWSKKLNTDRRGAPWQRECLNAYYRSHKRTSHGMKRIRISFE